MAQCLWYSKRNQNTFAKLNVTVASLESWPRFLKIIDMPCCKWFHERNIFFSYRTKPPTVSPGRRKRASTLRVSFKALQDDSWSSKHTSIVLYFLLMTFTMVPYPHVALRQKWFPFYDVLRVCGMFMYFPSYVYTLHYMVDGSLIMFERSTNQPKLLY